MKLVIIADLHSAVSESYSDTSTKITKEAVVDVVIVAVLKTVGRDERPVGSNPTISAKTNENVV